MVVPFRPTTNKGLLNCFEMFCLYYFNIRMMRIVLFLSICFCLFSACKSDRDMEDTHMEHSKGSLFSFLSLDKKETAGVSEYIGWVEDSTHGLIAKRMLGGMSYQTQYYPVDYCVLRQGDLHAMHAATLDQGRKDNGNTECFVFTIEDPDHSRELLKSGVESPEEYQERIEYCSFYIQNDLFLIDGTDTLPCRMSHFERTYGISPKAKFTLLFDSVKGSGKQKKSSTQDKTLVYFDRMFANGIIKMRIKASDIERIPELIID